MSSKNSAVDPAAVAASAETPLAAMSAVTADSVCWTAPIVENSLVAAAVGTSIDTCFVVVAAVAVAIAGCTGLHNPPNYRTHRRGYFGCKMT